MILFLSIKHIVNNVIIRYIVYDDICLMVRKINYFILFIYFITGQCFSGEHLGSFLAGTGTLEKIKMFPVADFEDVMKLRTNQHVAEHAKIGDALNNYRRPNGCEREGERHNRCKVAVGFGPLKIREWRQLKVSGLVWPAKTQGV
jgi:hypothetical protein